MQKDSTICEGSAQKARRRYNATALTLHPAPRLATVPDVRVAWMSRFLSLSLSKALPLMVPRLLPLHVMLRQANPAEPVQLLPSLALSSEKLQDDGVYLAENGFEGYIYFAQRVPTELVRALTGSTAPLLSCPSALCAL